MCFDIDAHKGCFKTNPNEAYFWHGQTNGCGGQYNAMDIADKNNGKTLEMCMIEHRTELEGAGVIFKDHDDKTISIDYGNNRDESKQFWDDCSKAFAEQSFGNVYVIEGRDLRPNGQSERDYASVYNRIEHPTLEQNHNVNSITHIDPYTRQPTETESFNRLPLSSETGNAVTCGATKNDMDPINSPQTNTGTPAGCTNRNELSSEGNSSVLNNLNSHNDNASNEALNTTKNMAGGMNNG